MSRILWISDGPGTTGFGTVTAALGERLMDDHGHDVSVLASAYDAADPVSTPLHLYRAEAGRSRHPLGFDRVLEVFNKVGPDVVVTLEDPAVLLKRLLENAWDPEQVLRQAVPIISYLPVDGLSMPPAFSQLKSLTNVVAMSKFGQDAFPGSKLIYHGVDTNLWHPVSEEHPLTVSNGVVMHSKAECREAFGLPQAAFVVGRVDSNSGRKDWGSTFRVIEGLRENYRGEVVPFWHTKRQTPGGIDIDALISRGDGSKYAVTDRDDWPTEDLVAMVNCFDVTLSTSRGEGFGLNLAQSLACAVPVVATDCSAISEVVGPGGVLVAGSAVMTNPYGVDHMLADVPAMTVALVDLARKPDERRRLGVLGREHVRVNFNWDVAAGKFHPLIEALAAHEPAQAGTTQRRPS
jgi:glycosyltransferase involved in cell wall biosynthesis